MSNNQTTKQQEILKLYKNSEAKLFKLRNLLDEGEQTGLSYYYYDEFISELDNKI